MRQLFFYGSEKNPAAVNIAAYKPEYVAEMHEAIKEVFDSMFEAILNGEVKKI